MLMCSENNDLFFCHCCSEITVQFARGMYMVRESDGMVDVMVVASGKTSFSYMFTVTAMDITATSKLEGVLVKS